MLALKQYLEIQGADGGHGAAHGVAEDIPGLARVVRLQLPGRLRDVGLQAAGVVGEEEPCTAERCVMLSREAASTTIGIYACLAPRIRYIDHGKIVLV